MRDTGERRVMICHSLELAAARCVPDADRLIGRTGGDATAIIGQKHRVDRAGVPVNVASVLPSARFQIRAVLSAEPVTILVPSRLTFTLSTASPCPLKSRTDLPWLTSQSLAVLSAEAETIRLPSFGENTIA